MDSEYDQKFEEMKKYIPFLESMIKRLESTSASSGNPRQAQLDKIRSLRDLLLNKKKRMKMENLLKCEQVLINLYAKVEQRDTLSIVKKAPDPGFSIDPPTPQEKSNLEAVRNKLKTVSKRQEAQDTLPEILRVNEVEDVHTTGSKEPALFQRRPKASLSPTHRSPTKIKQEKVSPPTSATKRNYTRVLVSPDTSARRWSTSENAEDKPLFSRRSPRRSPRRYSPSYHKKERKKSSKESSSRKSKGLNITLKVPEDSLSTLNTKDIFSRIINCSDGDVDIDTLRELRKQILTELKKTGAKDDISDLILKSYNKKTKSKNKNKKKDEVEVEEGELSDSESEVIENVYGNLCGNLVFKDQNETKTSPDQDKARKIQICLVINPDKDNTDPNSVADLPKTSDELELEMYDQDLKVDNKTASSDKEEKQPELVKIDDEDGKVSNESNKNIDAKAEDDSGGKKTDENVTDVNVDVSKEVTPPEEDQIITQEPVQYKPNFYKPLTDSTSESVEPNKLEEKEEAKPVQKESENKEISKTESIVSEVSVSSKDVCPIEAELEKMEKHTEIPLLNEPTIPKTPTNDTVSEIEILQALKNEILGESIAITGSEASTPPLHQPKIVKVASAKEILPKKRISIENYKQKVVSSIRFYVDHDSDSKDDLIKKPSLKLTEKECERFNLSKLSFDDDSSDGDDGSEIQASDVYSDLAPKSPDRDESTHIGTASPVIIPVDPVKAVSVNHKSDIDMRTLPILSPNKNKAPTLHSNSILPTNNEISKDITKSDAKADQNKTQNRQPLLDPRVRRDMSSNQSPSPHSVNPDRTPRTFSNFKQSPATNAVMTPNARSYEMTPNHQSFDFDQSNKKHVYVPSFTMFDTRERENSVAKEPRDKIESQVERKSRLDDIGDASWSSSDVSQRYSDSYTGDKYKKCQRNDRYSIDNRDPYSNKRSECPKTPLPSFGRSDVPANKPMTPLHPFGRGDCPTTPSHPFGRSECPPTPSHPYGRSECPPTPSHSFGRSECPPTPSHSFGRSECPPTPSHTFGRSEGPSTPSHPFGSHSYNINETFGVTTIECPTTPTPFFGRNDCPPTPNHSFGRSDCSSTPNRQFGVECPQTPNHPFGRSDASINTYGRSDYNAQKFSKDPRLNRKSEYELNPQFDERDRGYHKDRGYYRGSSYRSDSYQSQDRDQRNSKYRYYAPDHGRQLSKDHPRREHSVGRSMAKDNENDRLYSRDRGRYNTDNRSYEEVGMRRGNQRERSVGRNVYPEDRRERSVGRNAYPEDKRERSVGRSVYPEDRRERSVGRNVRSEDNFTRSSRAPSVGHHSLMETENKTLSVKPHAGRSFTIDTSVNATFQNFLESGKGIQVFEYNSDARRQRAASVGRSLVRESSVGRVMIDRKQKPDNRDEKREVFRRASSVGRDLANFAAEERSFQEIKADFKTYKHPVKEISKFDTGKIRNIDTKSKSSEENIGRSRKELYEKDKEDRRGQSVSKTAYSPRKNYRDPRMRKEVKSKNNDRYQEESSARKSGIVYSNDNIVKGAILASGYGVKNYKIPKIKRAVEEKELEPSKEELDSKKDEKDKRKIGENTKDLEDTDKEKERVQFKETSKQKNKETPKDKTKETSKGKSKEIINDSDDKSDAETDKYSSQVSDTSKSDEQTEKRLTRSSRRMAGSPSGTFLTRKTRKSRKAIISDSESDTDNSAIEKLSKDKTDVEVTSPAPLPQVTSPLKGKKGSKKPSAVDVDTHFGLEELEMFSDNVVSDPVLDNINALIADLDNDLDASKNETNNDFTKEISLENMMENITSPEDSLSDCGEFSKISNNKMDEVPLSKLKEDEAKSNVALPITKVSEDRKSTEALNITQSKASELFDNLLNTKEPEDKMITQNDLVSNKPDETLDTSLPLNKPTNDAIVSTTETENNARVEDKLKTDEQSIDGCSTPDSTINTDEIVEKPKSGEGTADSTNEEVHGETNVTSTESVEPKPSSTRTDATPGTELDSLLMILKNKSKLKEFLNILGDQSSDNDKIKKKLEKISEIVSDDETEQQEESKSEADVLTDDKTVDIKQTGTEKAEVTEERKAQTDHEQIPINKNDEDQDKDESTEDFIGDESIERDDDTDQTSDVKGKKKIPVRRGKFSKRGKGRYAKKVTSIAEKRITRATAAVETKQKPKKPPRELQKLHEDIKEMYNSDEILSATGIRMCRLAKMVEDKTKDEAVIPEVEPVVVLEKFKNSAEKSRDVPIIEKVRKKPGPKPKPKISNDNLLEEKSIKYKPGPKSKTKSKKESDPYAFETESVGDNNTEKASDDESDSSDSEISSLASSKSFGSSEILADIKKKTKRKRRGGWQDGVIKPKSKKRKVEARLEPAPEPLDFNLQTEKQISIPDKNCFTDRNYCFRKNELIHSCRLCKFVGTDIVHHYKNEHPHVEIPLSRMAPALAKEAIEQCKEINFQAVRKVSSEKYICIFCSHEFSHNKTVLETFFWHVVSMHTGEYKHNCSECLNESRCPFSLDIPPPPKDTKGQLIGYICKKCNFTQLSLENLKTHVIVRHNDEQTAVYTINLSAMSKKALKEFLRRCEVPEPPAVQANIRTSVITKRVSAESNDVTDDTARVCESDEVNTKCAKKSGILASIQSKITFEADDNVSEFSDLASEGPGESTIKLERVDTENTDEIMPDEPQPNEIVERPAQLPIPESILETTHQETNQPGLTLGLVESANQPSNDIVDYPHFKINITETGAKEYICCINGKDNHFKTTLLISMKKHVQLKHSEKWDGYCFVCKVIVTPQGSHLFKECFQHYLDKHMDNFPIFHKEVTPEVTPEKVPDKQISPAENKPYINVRPIYELISSAAEATPKETPSFPIIQSVVSLGAADPPQPSPTYPTVRQEKKPTEVSFKYEEIQAKVMSNKHRVVLESMMAQDKLVRVYKCAGRFCSFTSDSAEHALLHASTHQRIGGVDALCCSYCDFDAAGNAIDLVMHVFSAHGHCQYSCGQCFYRAAASQSVGAHAARVHGVTQSSATVLRTTTVTTNTAVESHMLTREQAVPYYVCNHVETATGPCKFRTYTPDKFCEHLQQKHGGAPSHPCYMCQSQESSPSDLVQHMKTHGLKLYQCTWCILGADNEADLLAHVSTVHPTKQPQAYLRIITNKEGSNELRVLPLAFLNKLKVPTIDVTPSSAKENPVREAERSIDLEKLIGLTMFVETQNEPNEPNEPPPAEDEPPEVIIPQPVAEVAPEEPVPAQVTRPLSPISKAVASIIRPIIDVPETHLTVATLASAAVDPPQEITQQQPIKAEPLETPKTLPGEVVVLDSDDDECKLSIIDLSDDDLATTPKRIYANKKVRSSLLGTCPKCRQVCKSMQGLKKHLFHCYPNKEDPSRCPHCPYVASDRLNIIQHYYDDHCDRNIYQCGICGLNQPSLSLTKKHVKQFHKEKDLVVTSSTENGISCFSVFAAQKEKEKRELPKRKLSATNTTTTNNAETSAKRKFSPQEIHLLPINPILEDFVFCDICGFNTKVRLNMVRHLQLHASQQPVAQSAPVNPVPHLHSHEKHFDKMLNLAASSIATRAPERPERAPLAAVRMAPELAARYPQQISARQRNTCGAVGCSYTSVDEPMLKRHWEALHSGPASFNFRCVHCPNNQITDTSKPITASRVIAHLKMHDDTLYACSKCNFYHFKRDFLEKHLTEVHPNGQLMIVRENASAAAAAAPAAPSAAPTMDLKPWQCGFCKFKSMLRPEVVDHCSKFHQSKMQFRCAYCPYRASAIENVNNHLANSHPSEPVDVIHYYYREGSLPDDAAGTPRWMVQRQKLSATMPEVKTEEHESPEPSPAPPVNIDLNLVKKEVDEEAAREAVDSMDDLCKKFGEFCEPNGIKFRCPLCKVGMEDTREAMECHLYEELQYRRFECGVCTYKAFHKAGLARHMTVEHRRQYDHIELPGDPIKDKWIAGLLDHQAAIIDKHKANLAKQKIIVERSKPAPSVAAPPTVEVVEKYALAQLVEAFGEFGEPSTMMFCCPKCNTLIKDEAAMRDHLEMELNKIRWGCTNCSDKYQTYHEAQFHCKGHDGPSRPKEAIRDPSMRAAWVTNIIQAQKRILQNVPVTPTTSEPPTPEKSFTENDNSLLVVRYEERVPTPDQVPVVRRKRSAPDSDDEKLIIDEKRNCRPCPHCPFTSNRQKTWKEHVLRHYNLKPFACCYCDYSCTYRPGVIMHTEKTHPDQPMRYKMSAIPPAEPDIITLKKKVSVDEDSNSSLSPLSTVICLFCEKSVPESEAENHLHDNIRPDFAKKGDVVVKCCICLVLRLDVKSLQDHHNLAHPDKAINYALFKMSHDTREKHYCGHCTNSIGFKFLRDLRVHHTTVHPFLLFKYTTVPYTPGGNNEEIKKPSLGFPPPSTLLIGKRCARKSTTKLPGGKTVAKKSTTKLPYSVPSTSEDGYSYYKTKPAPLEEYANVTTLMSFCNSMMPFTLKKLSEIINIEPKVLVKDIRAGSTSDK